MISAGKLNILIINLFFAIDLLDASGNPAPFYFIPPIFIAIFSFPFLLWLLRMIQKRFAFLPPGKYFLLSIGLHTIMTAIILTFIFFKPNAAQPETFLLLYLCAASAIVLTYSAANENKKKFLVPIIAIIFMTIHIALLFGIMIALFFALRN